MEQNRKKQDEMVQRIRRAFENERVETTPDTIDLPEIAAPYLAVKTLAEFQDFLLAAVIDETDVMVLLPDQENFEPNAAQPVAVPRMVAFNVSDLIRRFVSGNSVIEPGQIEMPPQTNVPTSMVVCGAINSTLPLLKEFFNKATISNVPIGKITFDTAF
jgi:hypothetical protein